MDVLQKPYQIDVEQAVSEYADMVYRLALVKTGQPTDADDVFSEVFLRLLKYKDKIQSPLHLKAWLLKVTVSCCNRHHTSFWRKRVLSTSDTELDKASCSQDFPSDNYVWESIQKLPQNQRDVVHLYYFEQYPVKEIAGILGKPEGTIKSLLSRGRESLKNLLSEEPV